MEVLGKRLRKLRMERKMTQEDLAQRLHVTRQAVSNWENGKTAVGIEYMVQLSEIYGVSVDEIIYGKRAGEREAYPQKQRKYMICFVICTVTLMICMLLNITVKPKLMQLYYGEFVYRPYYWYRHIVPAIMATAAGVLLPSMISMFRDIRLWGKWKRLARILAVVWLVPVALGVIQYLGWLPIPVGGVWGSVFEIWWNLKFYRELFFLAGGCFFLGLNR